MKFTENSGLTPQQQLTEHIEEQFLENNRSTMLAFELQRENALQKEYNELNLEDSLLQAEIKSYGEATSHERSEKERERVEKQIRMAEIDQELKLPLLERIAYRQLLAGGKESRKTAEEFSKMIKQQA